MARNTILAVAVLALAAAGCSHATAGTSATVEPSASIRENPQIAGHWQGSVYENAASLIQGHTPLDLTIKDDGTWAGKVGKGEGSGTARLDRHGNLVLSGVATTPNGVSAPVNYTLRGNSMERWNVVSGDFTGGRPASASILLKKIG
jgi:hypothetical protein